MQQIRIAVEAAIECLSKHGQGASDLGAMTVLQDFLKMLDARDEISKRYLVFAFDRYDPFGGFSDVQQSSDDEEVARTIAEKLLTEWDFVEMYDVLSGKLLTKDEL